MAAEFSKTTTMPANFVVTILRITPMYKHQNRNDYLSFSYNAFI